MMIQKKRRRLAPHEKNTLGQRKKSDPTASYSAPKQDAERKTEHLSSLLSITKTISQTLNVEEILDKAVNLIKDALVVETVVIFTVDWSKDMLNLRAERGTPKSFLPILTRGSLGETLSGRAVQMGEQIYVEDFVADPRVEGTTLKDLRHEGPGSVVATPLKARGKILGVLTVRDKRPKRFTAQELLLLNSVAEQLAVAIENARLFEEAKSKSEQLAALIQINRGIAALMDREALLSCIAEDARKLLHVDGTSFRLVEGDYLVRKAHAGEKDLLALREKMGLGESITGKIIRDRRAIALKNLLKDPTVIGEHREILKKAGYHSLLGVPLLTGDMSIGALNLYSKEEREFTSGEVDLITAFADQATIALENARLFADLQEANRAKSDFMAAMSHELRTPLNVIVGNADLIRDGFFGEVSEKQRDSLKKILRHSQVLLKLINDVLMLTKLDAKKMTLDVSTFNLEEVLGHTRTFV